MELRKTVATSLKEEPGIDLGFEVREIKVSYMEAYKRYSGNLYREINEDSWIKLNNNPNLKMLIVSALYGLVNFKEHIRYYNRKMDVDKVDGKLLKTWWSQQWLSDILIDYVKQNRIEVVHDFLSTHYKEAIQPFPSNLEKINVQYIPHDYAGLGSGSDYYRGKDVNNLIQTFNI
ncbi:MAG: peroxide stress protein YaaA, partial [Candidatus Bathyarchaeia archaeon]